MNAQHMLLPPVVAIMSEYFKYDKYERRLAIAQQKERNRYIIADCTNETRKEIDIVPSSNMRCTRCTVVWRGCDAFMLNGTHPESKNMEEYYWIYAPDMARKEDQYVQLSTVDWVYIGSMISCGSIVWMQTIGHVSMMDTSVDMPKWTHKTAPRRENGHEYALLNTNVSLYTGCSYVITMHKQFAKWNVSTNTSKILDRGLDVLKISGLLQLLQVYLDDSKRRVYLIGADECIYCDIMSDTSPWTIMSKRPDSKRQNRPIVSMFRGQLLVYYRADLKNKHSVYMMWNPETDLWSIVPQNSFLSTIVPYFPAAI
jgi:hypothetical protein